MEDKTDYYACLNEIDYIFKSTYRKDDIYVKPIYNGYEHKIITPTSEFLNYALINEKKQTMCLTKDVASVIAYLEMTTEQQSELLLDLHALFEKYKSTGGERVAFILQQDFLTPRPSSNSAVFLNWV